jgi:hypothetical protein
LKHSLSKTLLALFIACLSPCLTLFGETNPSGADASNTGIWSSGDLEDPPFWLNSFCGDIGVWPIAGSTSSSQAIGQDLCFTHSLASVEKNEVSLSTGIHYRQLDEEPELPEEAQSASLDPWNVNLGLNYSQPLGDRWKATTAMNIASASDHPVTTLREMNVGLNATLRMPHDEHNAWIFSVNYAPVSEASIPVPGVAFSYDPSPRFHANIGFPFQAIYRPTDVWEFQASYMLAHTIHAKTLYKITDRFSMFAAYDWASESIVLLDIPEPNSRFTINDPRVSTGVQTTLSWRWTALASVGYVFDRYLFDGTSFSQSAVTPLEPGNGAFASVNVDLRY